MEGKWDVQFMLINWSTGAVIGCHDTEEEAKSQAVKIVNSNEKLFKDHLVVCEMKAHYELKREWSAV